MEISPDESGDEEASKLSAIIGLKAIATRPYLGSQGIKFDDQLEEDNRNYLGSVEYWVLKKDLQSNGATVKTTVFPILPMGTQKVRRERLVFTKDTDSTNSEQVKNSGRLCFIPEAESITVYRNGTLYNNWTVDDSNTVTSPNSGVGVPMVTYVQVLKADMRLGDIFTVSYTPITSDSYSIQYLTDQVVVDLLMYMHFLMMI